MKPPNNSLQLTRLASGKLELALPARLPESGGSVARAAGQLSSMPLCAKQAWRFLQGGSPCRVRPNQPPAPRVAVVEEVTRPNETAEAYPGNHIGRKGDRTP